MDIEKIANDIAGTLAGAFVFLSPEGAGAVVVQYNAQGEAYVVDIDEHGNTRSGMVTLETGWTA